MVATQHGEVADLSFLHQSEGLGAFLILEADDQFWRHHLVDSYGLRISSFGNPPRYEVALCKDTHDTVAVAHRECADVGGSHPLGRLL